MSAGNRRTPPKRWVELEGAKSDLVREAAELSPPTAQARVRVAEKLVFARAQRGAGMMRFAIAGAVLGALIVLIAIQLSPRAESRVARVVASEGQVEVAGDPNELAVGDGVRVAASGSARLELGESVALTAKANTALALSELDRRVAVRIDGGEVEVIALEELAIVAGPWSVSTFAGRFVVALSDRALVVEVREGEVAIDGPERARVAAGQRFESKREPAVVAEVESAEPPQKVIEEGRNNVLPRKLRTNDLLRKSRDERVNDADAPSEEQLYQRARDERDPTQAIALYDQVTAIRGSYAEIAAYQAARTAMKNGRTRDAIARFRALLADRPSGVYAHEATLDLIECRLVTGELDEARIDLETFLHRYPESERSAELRFLRAELARMKKNYRAAIADYESAFNSSRDADARFFRALSLMDLGELAQAKTQFQDYLTRHPQGTYRARAEEAIGRIDDRR